MGFIGGEAGYRLLKALSKDGSSTAMDGSAYANKSKLETLLGAGIWDQIKGKVVMDFGCGCGDEAIEMAAKGARLVIGLDIQDQLLHIARDNARRMGVADRCTFSKATQVRADVITAIDSFEHFRDPAGILSRMRSLVRDDGCVLASFGPTWFHPYGGHLFSVFPWAHLVFTEKALIRWRSDFKSDRATRFGEVEGGLNQMTIGRFEELVDKSAFRFAELEAVPIRRLRPMANRLTREFTTAIVRCRLVPRDSAQAHAGGPLSDAEV